MRDDRFPYNDNGFCFQPVSHVHQEVARNSIKNLSIGYQSYILLFF